MSLNPSAVTSFSETDITPSAKLTLNINAFNGNTTNINRCLPRPSPKSITSSTAPRFPIQPTTPPSLVTPPYSTTIPCCNSVGLLRPM